MGQSCGGFLSITLGADPRVKTIGVFNSGVQPARPESNEDAVQKVHGPVLLINGAERDFLSPASLATFELINSVPAFYGARHDAGHTATVDHPGGGEFANVASNWLLWQFKNDKRAAKMFVGNDCDLCTNTNWDVRAKGYKDARNEGPAATFNRGSSQQAWQNAGYKTALAKCKNPPQPFAIPCAANPATAAAPPAPVLPPTMSIPGVLEARQTWKVVWSWEGNNVDGPIAATTAPCCSRTTTPATSCSSIRRPGSRRSPTATSIPPAPSRAARTARCLSPNAGSAAASKQLEPSAKDAGEFVQRRAARMHRRRDQRSHGRRQRRCVLLRYGRSAAAASSTPARMASSHSTERTCRSPTASSSARTRRRCT